MLSLTAAEAAEKIRTGNLASEDLVQALIDKARRNDHLNAFITLDPEHALTSAREADEQVRIKQELGPLHGVPLVIKDNIEVAGLPNTAGTPGLLNHVPKQHAPIIQALVNAGAIILGKTNMHELGVGITSDNAHFGAVANPYNSLTFAGGSSGGTAAAVAARMAPAGLGTDTGGSVRIPAALTGICGFRPSMGRYSQEGITPISTTRDTAGPIARSVEDIALLDTVITGATSPLETILLERLRLGVPRKPFYENLHEATARLVDRSLARLEAVGVTLVEADMPGMRELYDEVAFPMARFELVRALPNYLSTAQTAVSMEQLVARISSPDVAGLFAHILGEGAIPEKVYQDAINLHLPAFQAVYHAYFERYRLDALIFPTTPIPARLIEGALETVDLNGTQVPTSLTYIYNTDPSSTAGVPCLTLPIGLTPDGLPVGIEIDGPKHTDRRLLAIGLMLEKVVGKLPAPNLP